VWVARDPSAGVVGYAVGWRVLDEVQILSFAVDPDWRRLGIGRELLKALLSSLRGEGVGVVMLEVRASNLGAQALYREAGFKTNGERPRYYPGGESALLLGAEL
jgi:ribosomal-protein-alanine N-acetyltransferase